MELLVYPDGITKWQYRCILAQQKLSFKGQLYIPVHNLSYPCRSRVVDRITQRSIASMTSLQPVRIIYNHNFNNMCYNHHAYITCKLCKQVTLLLMQLTFLPPSSRSFFLCNILSLSQSPPWYMSIGSYKT